jgi:hypothetical protein
MVKRLCTIVIAASFLLAAVPLTAGAAQPFYKQKILVQNIAGLQQKIAVEDPTGLSAVTLQFLDEILAAGLNDNKADLQLAVLRYVSDVQQIQSTLALDNETTCLISYSISAVMGTVGMITELSSGNSTFCIVNNLSNKAADIAIANCKYNICLIDKTSSYTGTKTRDEWVAEQKSLAIYNFATSATNVFLCTASPGAQNYISLLFDLIAIFNVK